MARIAKFRAVLETDKGQVSRLSSGMVSATLNTQDWGIETRAYADGFMVQCKKVQYISSTGAGYVNAVALHLSAQDMEDLTEGRKKLALVKA